MQIARNMVIFVFMKLYESGDASDTLVASYYPLGGNDQNTGPRYQAEAELTGFDVLGIPRSGSDTLRPNRHLHNALSPEHFDDFMTRDANIFNGFAVSYDRVIWRGQSASSFPTLSMVKTGAVKATHMLLEDGINLRTPVGAVSRAYYLGVLDWYSYDKLEQQVAPEVPEDWSVPEADDQHPVIKAAKFFVEQYHWSALWRSNYSRQAVLEIIENQPELPISIKFLGHSATGNLKQATETMELIDIAAATRSNGGEPVAEVRTAYDKAAWHKYLTYPQYGADNLTEVADMKSYAATTG